jgi:hypothetical protein
MLVSDGDANNNFAAAMPLCRATKRFIGKARLIMAFEPDVSDEDGGARKSGAFMTKRKIGLFFVIAITVFVASRGTTNVRHADASAERAPTTQPSAAALINSSSK